MACEYVMKQMKIMLCISEQGYFDSDFEHMCVDFLQHFDKMNVTNTVDFSKAINVNRSILFYKLIKSGYKGKIVHLLQDKM